MHHAVCTVGKKKLPLLEHKTPLPFPAPHGSIRCRKAQQHIVFPLSLTESWFSHQNIAVSSFQLIKGQLDISLLHQSQLCLVEMEHGKVLIPKTLSSETSSFKSHASYHEIWKKKFFCTYVWLRMVFTI